MNNLLSSVRHCSGTTQVEIFLSDHLNGIHRRPSDETQTGDKMNGRKKEGGGIARLLAGFCNRVVMQSDHGVSSRHWNESTCVFSERQPCLWFISCFRTVLQRLSLSARLPFLRHGIVLPSSPRFFFFSLSTLPTETQMLREWFNVLWIHGTCVSLFLFGFFSPFTVTLILANACKLSRACVYVFHRRK